jgi:hypothetical protein
MTQRSYNVAIASMCIAIVVVAAYPYFRSQPAGHVPDAALLEYAPGPSVIPKSDISPATVVSHGAPPATPHTAEVSATSPAARQNLPAVKVAVGGGDGRVVLLVPARTTDAELVNLVNALRNARRDGSLVNFFPPTTPRGSSGPYGVVEAFVMSDAAWATAPRLRAFMDPHGSGEAANEFGRRVRAYYLLPMGGQEYGSVGYEDPDTRYKTPNYKRLF